MMKALSVLGSTGCIGRQTLSVAKAMGFRIVALSTNKNILHKIDATRIRPIDADLQIPDTSAFTKYVEWEPEYSFDQTMKDLLEYWRKLVDKNGNVYLQR